MAIHKKILKELKAEYMPGITIKFTLDENEVVDDEYTIWVIFRI